MAAYNFGQLTAGLPDLGQRQASQQVLGDDYYQGQQNDWLSGWQNRYDAAQPTWVQTGGPHSSADISPLLNTPGASNGIVGGAPAFAEYAQTMYDNAGNGDSNALAYLSNFGLSAGASSAPTGYYDNSARNALNTEKTSQQAQYDAMMQTRQKNQQAQQSAYDQSNGGGFLGGTINSSYSTPFGMTGGIGAPTQTDGVNMPNTQPWGMAGYGGATGAASQGGFGVGLMAQGANQSQPSGWGGPFTNKNPWAAS